MIRFLNMTVLEIEEWGNWKLRKIPDITIIVEGFSVKSYKILNYVVWRRCDVIYKPWEGNLQKKEKWGKKDVISNFMLKSCFNNAYSVFAKKILQRLWTFDFLIEYDPLLWIQFLQEFLVQEAWIRKTITIYTKKSMWH